MRLRVFTEPQEGATYEKLAEVAKASEQLGYDAFFRSDHLRVIGQGDGLPGPTDAWLTLAALARETTTIRLGTLVTSATFRMPGPLAISVAQADQMSGGRIDFGVGAGWYESEHVAYGIPFPSVGERFDRFEEQLEVITGLWSTPVGETFSYDGAHYRLIDSPALPKPVQDPIPIIIGGFGATRTPALTARFAHEFNLAFGTMEQWLQQRDRVDAACVAIGRDPASVRRTVALTVICGRDDAEVARRADVIHRAPDELRQHQAAGTVDEVIARLLEYRDAGAETAYLQFLDLDDHDHLALVAEAVMPAIAD